jgi:hypothetical protein
VDSQCMRIKSKWLTTSYRFHVIWPHLQFHTLPPSLLISTITLCCFGTAAHIAKIGPASESWFLYFAVFGIFYSQIFAELPSNSSSSERLLSTTEPNLASSSSFFYTGCPQVKLFFSMLCIILQDFSLLLEIALSMCLFTC